MIRSQRSPTSNPGPPGRTASIRRPRRWFVLIVPAMVVAALATVPPQLSAAPPTAEERQTDESIARALVYLSRQQRPSGAWQHDRFGESTAATSLAVMAFLAAGHVPGEGPYGPQIEKGIRWVLDHQHPNGMLVHARSHGPMYSHGISTLMLAEVVGMVDKSLAGRCRKALEEAIALILKAQEVPKQNRHQGGWRYDVTSRDSDLSVTGWQLLALRAAKDVGCDVPADNIASAVQYVENCQGRGGVGFAYQPGSSPTATRTGTGILALEVCGEHKAPESIAGADFLLRRPLRYDDHYFFYGVYYCSVGMFKVGGDYWTETKSHLRTQLLNHQNADGSWLARNGSEQDAGRIYCTAMSVLALAVEYQYLPIYQR